MLLAAVLLITTTIRLSAMSRRRETGIMRLVGASNLFIQLPFMLEGAIAATVGAALAVGALWLGVRYLVTDWLGGQVAVDRLRRLRGRARHRARACSRSPSCSPGSPRWSP